MALVALFVATAVVAAPVALASPTPSPSLGGILIAPSSSEYTESDRYINGPMSAQRWAGDDTRMLDELRIDNYVAGYARSFTSSNDKVLFEAVGVFSGAQDAKRFLTFIEASPDDDYYVHPLLVDNVDSFVGAHYADTAKSEYWDHEVFVKGNDVFELYADSKKDDLGDIAATQAKRQFDAAPRYTIPPSQWPENAGSRTPSSFSLSGALLPIALTAAGLLLVTLLVIGLVVLLGRTGQTAKPRESAAQMSSDGRYWWDGQTWRDTEQGAPPSAMRSADGYYWWDGQRWRTVPTPTPGPAPSPSPTPTPS